IGRGFPTFGLAAFGRLSLGLDPADGHSRRHDHRLGLLTRDVEAVERPGVARGLPVLAFRPAGKVVRGAAGEVLDRLDAILAEFDQRSHRRACERDQGGRHARLPMYSGPALLRAALLALGLLPGLDHREIVAGPALELLRGLLVEAFDRG